MSTQYLAAAISGRKDWRSALMALRRLAADANNTKEVFKIMRALNAGTAKTGYERLLQTEEGGRLAFEHAEIGALLSDSAAIAAFAPGTLGAAYAAFLVETGYTAEGLAAASRVDDASREAPHPYAWFGRRTRDTHDLWHILTGYRANDRLGEACLAAFYYAQTRGAGWALIARGAGLRALAAGSIKKLRALREAYRNGRRAVWLHGEDYALMLAEPLDALRTRLGIVEPKAYRAAEAV